MRDIATTLSTMLGEGEINRFTRDGRSYKVIPQAGRDFRLTQGELEKYYLRAASGQLVPLSSVISLRRRVEPNVLSQYQQLNSTTIQGMMMPPNTLGTGLRFSRKSSPRWLRADSAPATPDCRGATYRRARRSRSCLPCPCC
jgi:multidrug efflux pump subunit AcrB